MRRSSRPWTRPRLPAFARLPAGCLALALIGCGGGDPSLEPSPAEALPDADVVLGYAVEDAAGAAPLGAWVRAVNGYGAAIPAEPVQLQVDGVGVDVALDSTGYGVVHVELPGTTRISGGLAPATAHAFESDWPGFGLDPAHAAPAPGASHAVAVTTGMVVARGDELWWVGPQGRSHRVLKADGAITGMRARHVDVDDFLDVVAWTELTVFVLRGRMSGGMAWGTALTAPGYTVGGADVGDLDNDNLADLAIGWVADSGTSKLDVHHGDGLYGFTAAAPRNLPAAPTSVAIGDNTGEGKAQITVVDTDGDWSRYISGTPTRYIPIGPARPDSLLVPVGSTLDASGDLNGTGGEQIWIYGPRNPGSPRTIQVVDLKGQRIEYIPLNPPAPFVTRADGDGDGLIDLFLLHEDRSLHSLSYDQSTLNFVPRQIEVLPAYAPFAVAHWLGARAVDLFLAGDDLWRFWEGAADPEDPGLFWRLAEPRLDAVGDSVGPIAIVELDADPATTDIVAFERSGADLRLAVERWTAGGNTLARRGQTVIAAGGDPPVDVAVCERVAWVLLPGELVRVSLANPAAPSVQGRQSTQATRIACGDGPDGAAAAALSQGQVQLLGAGGGEVGVVSAPGAGDVALGAGELQTCAGADCRVAFWPWGDAGEASFVVSDGAGLHLDDDAAGPFVGWGELTVTDVDGDGRPELIAAGADGVLTILRSSGGAIAPSLHAHIPVGITGPVGVGDADGDGHADLWLVDGSGRIRHSRAAGAPAGDAGDPAPDRR